jgi:hypothetical protein
MGYVFQHLFSRLALAVGGARYANLTAALNVPPGFPIETIDFLHVNEKQEENNFQLVVNEFFQTKRTKGVVHCGSL